MLRDVAKGEKNEKIPSDPTRSVKNFSYFSTLFLPPSLAFINFTSFYSVFICKGPSLSWSSSRTEISYFLINFFLSLGSLWELTQLGSERWDLALNGKRNVLGREIHHSGGRNPWNRFSFRNAEEKDEKHLFSWAYHVVDRTHKKQQQQQERREKKFNFRLLLLVKREGEVFSFLGTMSLRICRQSLCFFPRENIDTTPEACIYLGSLLLPMF